MKCENIGCKNEKDEGLNGSVNEGFCSECHIRNPPIMGTFKFEKGQNWDGDEEIINYIEDLLLEERESGSFPIVKQETFITIHCSKKDALTKSDVCKCGHGKLEHHQGEGFCNVYIGEMKHKKLCNCKKFVETKDEVKK